MALGNCSFETERLVVDDWSRVLTGDAAEAIRDSFVVSLLTEAVTRDLPPEWQGPFDMDRAASWFAERQSENTVLVIVNRSDGRPVGLLILSESNNSDRRSRYPSASAWGARFRLCVRSIQCNTCVVVGPTVPTYQRSRPIATLAAERASGDGDEP